MTKQDKENYITTWDQIAWWLFRFTDALNPVDIIGGIRAKRKRKKESKFLAKKIYDIEHAHWKVRRDWLKNNVSSWELTDNIFLHESEDCMMWYLWLNRDDQARSFFKAVPKMFLTMKSIRDILKAQPWVCI